MNEFLISSGKLVSGIPISILRAWAISTLWGWFMVPLGLPPIGWAHAYGLLCTATLFQFYPAVKQDDDVDWSLRWSTHLAAPLVCVGIGWICLKLMAF